MVSLLSASFHQSPHTEIHWYTGYILKSRRFEKDCHCLRLETENSLPSQLSVPGAPAFEDKPPKALGNVTLASKNF